MFHDLVLEEAIIRLIRTKPFYGNFTTRMRRHRTTKVPTAGVSIKDDGIHLYYNPDFIKTLDDIQLCELIEHECDHILQLHPIRAKKYGLNEVDTAQKAIKFRRFNYAADAAINWKLENLTKDLGITVTRLNEMMKDYDSNHEDMEEHQSMEYYYERIKKFVDENADKLPQSDSHEMWEESTENETLAKDLVRGEMKRAIDASGGIGSCPDNVIRAYNELMESTVDWSQKVRQFVARTIHSDKTTSRTKRNRRYGLIYPGKKKDFKTQVDVAIDTSGSMSNEALGQIWAELKRLNDYTADINIIVSDAEVHDVYKFDASKKPKLLGGGGTCYAPALNEAKKRKPDAFIYFGDMGMFDREELTPTSDFPVLWAVCGDYCEEPPTWGTRIDVKIKNKE